MPCPESEVPIELYIAACGLAPIMMPGLEPDPVPVEFVIELFEPDKP